MTFIKECIAELRLRFRMEAAIAEKLEQHDNEIYAMRENEKLTKAQITKLTQDVQQLRLMLSKSVAGSSADNFGPGKAFNKQNTY